MQMNRWIAAALLGIVAVCPLSATAWDRTLSAGINLTRGNSDAMIANSGLEASRQGSRHEQRYLLTGNYGETKIDGGNEQTAGNARALAEYKYKLNGSYLYSNNSIFHDSIAGIDYRLIVGGGGGYYVLHSGAAKLGIELGLAYIREELDDDASDDTVAIRVAARHDQKLSDTAKMWAAIEYLPTADDFDLFLVNSEAGAEAVLNASLSLRVVLQLRHDSDVQEDRDRNDLSLISSLVYKL